jgi:hypothetical protein
VLNHSNEAKKVALVGRYISLLDGRPGVEGEITVAAKDVLVPADADRLK